MTRAARSMASPLLRCWIATGLLVVVQLAWAGIVVDRNPFDPERKPWTVPPPPLPELTAKDLQIEAIILFGAHKEIVVQLDGRLKGALPANAAGKVRIHLGQSFAGGYVLEEVTPNNAVVQAGAARYTIPVLRRTHRGAPPAPSQQVAEAPPPPSLQPTQAPANPAAPVANPFAAPQPQAPAVVAPTLESAVSTNQPVAPGNHEPTGTAEAAAPSVAPQMSLLDAIRKAQEASRNRQNAPTGGTGVPFGAK